MKMKPFIIAVSVLGIGSMSLMAQAQKTEKATDVTKNADGSVTKTETTTTTFTPDSRTKAVKYFDAYKGNPHGLPPAWAAKVRVKDVPTAWRTSIAPGIVVQETDRSYLVEAPDDLISVLPAPRSGMRYYVAGSNIVAVDSNYRVVDSIPIPSIKFVAD